MTSFLMSSLTTQNEENVDRPELTEQKLLFWVFLLGKIIVEIIFYCSCSKNSIESNIVIMFTA